MSEQPTTALPPVEAREVDTTAAAAADAPVPVAEATDAEAPAKPELTEVTAVDDGKPVEATPAPEAALEKTIEPITQGVLAWKGPGLVKSLIPSKKNFWLSDEPVAADSLDLYLRGEKPEIAHPVVAWAGQTGKGLLFANKKSETEHTHPADIFALYDATDLKKQSPHEFSFKLNGHSHTFKATTDAERDGWYLSLEKAIELSKASKQELHESEAYKAELEKLSKPNTVAAAAKRSQSQPKKSMDVEKTPAERVGSSDGEETQEKKQKKSRSTSRGMFNRLKGKKEDAEPKPAEAAVEKEEEKKEGDKPEDAGAVTEATEIAPVVAAVAAVDTPATVDAAESKPVEDSVAAEEKAKISKRGSIFGRVQSTWSGMRSPAKEKELKDAELKSDSLAKDAPVSENPPVLPETATTEAATEPTVPAVEEPEATAETPKQEAAAPGKEKTNFLSGLGFMKRGRSVSPSTNLKTAPKKEEAAVGEESATEPAVKVEEPVAEETPAAEEPVEKVEEPKTETTTANKRQSMLGSLGRRASKALNRMQAPKKEAPAAAPAQEADEVAPETAEESAVVAEEVKTEEATEEQKTIGDVVPDAVNVGQPQQSPAAVTASA